MEVNGGRRARSQTCGIIQRCTIEQMEMEDPK